ncbi:hypothetical protein LC55x_2992 [Lysobacter capsici]|nr:hypothetical protein LC55x_2992 [Lysobacter capsici]
MAAIVATSRRACYSGQGPCVRSDSRRQIRAGAACRRTMNILQDVSRDAIGEAA